MTFLPIVERELRVAARRRATLWVRLGAAGIALSAAAFVLITDGGSQKDIGRDLFTVLAVLLFVYAGVLGTQVTADCMSEEKREGTLGLLFLTDLKGYDVVFGKLAATSIYWLYGMVATVPILAIPFLLGGVSHGELGRVVLVALNLLFFSLSVGIWASTVSRRDTRAHSLAFIIAIAIFCLWPAVVHLRLHSNPNTRVADLSSPAFGCALAFDTVYNNQHQLDFWLNAVITQFYSWIFLGTACWIAPRCWQDAVVGKSLWQRLAPFAAHRPERRARLLTPNPFLWRASRAHFNNLVIWLVLAGIAALWLWQYGLLHKTRSRVDYFDPPLNFVFLIVAGLMVKSAVAAESGRVLGEDRRSGAMELLLSTRLRPADMVRGQQEALWRQFALPVAAVLAANVACAIVERRAVRTIGMDEEGRRELIWMHIVLGAFLVLDVIALSCIGMWHGFIARKPNRSAGPAMARVVFLPGLFFFLLMTFLSIMNAEPSGMSALLIWCVIGLGADAFALPSRKRLLARFQTIASEGRIRQKAAGPIPEPAPAPVEAA